MKAALLVTELRRRGADVVLDGEGLKLRAPKGSVGEDLKSQIAEAKPEILELLRADAEFDRLSRQITSVFQAKNGEDPWKAHAALVGPYGDAGQRLYDLVGEDLWIEYLDRKVV